MLDVPSMEGLGVWLMRPTKATQHGCDSPPVIAVMFQQLLNQAESVDLSSVEPHTHTRQFLWTEGFELSYQLCSEFGEFVYCGVSVTCHVASSFRPGGNADGFERGTLFVEHATNPQRIQVAVTVSNMPEVLEQRRLVVRWHAKQDVPGQREHSPLQECGHLFKLANKAAVGLLKHIEVLVDA